ncbi:MULTISPECIES: hypothetical protein [Thioclava]|uniref:Uncharacterized protein n=1 Tax=Thioclava litoralis TaxID=3076557 RepID=A0ABZ1E287_9RHOB|nr:hypothetical protein RPE78_04565 [Thioclava sp. FTW29]
MQNLVMRAYAVALLLLAVLGFAMIVFSAVDLLMRGYLPLVFVESRLIVSTMTATIITTVLYLVLWVMVCGALYLGLGIYANLRRCAKLLEALEARTPS